MLGMGSLSRFPVAAQDCTVFRHPQRLDPGRSQSRPALSEESVLKDDQDRASPEADRSRLTTKRNEVMEALRAVHDPELGMNVVELGLIRRIDLSRDKCHVEMILTTPFCPYAPEMLGKAREAAQGAAGVPTTIEMGTAMWDPSMMEEGAAGDWGLF